MKWWQLVRFPTSIWPAAQQHNAIPAAMGDGPRVSSARCSSPLTSITWSGFLLSAVLYQVPTSHKRRHLRDSGFNSVFHFLSDQKSGCSFEVPYQCCVQFSGAVLSFFMFCFFMQYRDPQSRPLWWTSWDLIFGEMSMNSVTSLSTHHQHQHGCRFST